MVSLSSGRSGEGTGRTKRLDTDGLERRVKSLYGCDGGTRPEHRGDELDRTGLHIHGRLICRSKLTGFAGQPCGEPAPHREEEVSTTVNAFARGASIFDHSK